MKIVAILSLCTIGMVYSASVGTSPQCTICKSAVKWVRSNEYVLSAMKFDDQVSQDYIQLIESDRSSQNICGLLAMCATTDETEDFLSNRFERHCICRYGHCTCDPH